MKEFAEAGTCRGGPVGKKIIANALGECYIFSKQPWHAGGARELTKGNLPFPQIKLAP